VTAQRCPEATYRTKPLAKRAAWAAALQVARANDTRVQTLPVEFCIRHNAWHVLGDVQPTTTKGRVIP
jgi:hypothetical protein